MASKSINRVILLGNLTRDPELKYTPQGTAVCTFGLATNRTWTLSTGEQKEEVQFHRIVAWQKLAELCGQLLSKGRKIYLEGRLVYRTFEGKDKTQHQVTEIIMNDFVLCDDKRKISSTTQNNTKMKPSDKEENDVNAGKSTEVKENEIEDIPIEDMTLEENDEQKLSEEDDTIPF